MIYETLKRIPLYAGIFTAFCFAFYGLMEGSTGYRVKENHLKNPTALTRPASEKDLQEKLTEFPKQTIPRR